MEKIASKSNDILPAENLEYTDTTYQVNVPLGKKLKLVSDSGVRPSFLMVGNGILNKNETPTSRRRGKISVLRLSGTHARAGT